MGRGRGRGISIEERKRKLNCIPLPNKFAKEIKLKIPWLMNTSPSKQPAYGYGHHMPRSHHQILSSNDPNASNELRREQASPPGGGRRAAAGRWRLAVSPRRWEWDGSGTAAGRERWGRGNI
jgi:hypothetical protein